ncbi:MAG: hypothetical protein HZB55_19180 [Deltaproteobacteria bacterium]|nr:hypothetical protein [Deltaproteobacteria bacterium]
MRFNLAALACLAVSVTAPAGAGSLDLAGDDLCCEASLGAAQAALGEVMAQVEAVSSRIDAARLQRSHAAWLRHQGTTCDLLSAGGPDMSCCMQRQIGERMADLRLFLAEAQPTSLSSWERELPTAEVEELRKYILERPPRRANPRIPDQFLRVGDAQYLLAYSSAPEGEQGLEYLNLRRRTSTKVKSGEVQLVRVLRDKADGKHLLVRCATIDRRIRWIEYYLVRIGREGAGLKAFDTRLALFQEDAGARRCDEHSAVFLKLEKAIVPRAVEFADADGDGHEDILFEVEEVQCRTQSTEVRRMTFLAGADGFVPAAQ